MCLKRFVAVHVRRYLLSVRDDHVFRVAGGNDIHRAPVHTSQCRRSVAHAVHGEQMLLEYNLLAVVYVSVLLLS